jgi:hypothetical protein
VALFDGPAPERAYAPRAVTIAAAFQDDQDAVTVERVESGARPDVTETADCGLARSTRAAATPTSSSTALRPGRSSP